MADTPGLAWLANPAELTGQRGHGRFAAASRPFNGRHSARPARRLGRGQPACLSLGESTVRGTTKLTASSELASKRTTRPTSQSTVRGTTGHRNQGELTRQCATRPTPGTPELTIRGATHRHASEPAGSRVACSFCWLASWPLSGSPGWWGSLGLWVWGMVGWLVLLGFCGCLLGCWFGGGDCGGRGLLGLLLPSGCICSGRSRPRWAGHMFGCGGGTLGCLLIGVRFRPPCSRPGLGPMSIGSSSPVPGGSGVPGPPWLVLPCWTACPMAVRSPTCGSTTIRVPWKRSGSVGSSPGSCRRNGRTSERVRLPTGSARSG